MAKTVVALFDDYETAQRVVDDLINAGFFRKDVTLITNNSAARFGTIPVPEPVSPTADKAGGCTVAEGAASGAAEGAVIGGLTGLAASLALFLIPGIGPIAAAGPLAATLSGAGIGAVGGGIIGGLSGMGIPEEDAGYYAEGVRRGGTLVALNTTDMLADQARDIFDRHNPIDINERGEYYRSTGYSGYSEAADSYTPEQIAAERAAYMSRVP